MSGHSKWSTIKRKKGALDAARGQVWTKVIRELMVAARTGGGDPDGNPRLRTAIDKAKAVNMPRDNIERAIKKGTGDLEGVTYEELVFEGYGPAGVALYIEILTDNRNRTSAEIRMIFGKGGGNLGSPGSVAFMFKKLGHFAFDAAKHSEDQVMEIALDGGADDVKTVGSRVVVLCAPESFEALKKAFEAKKMVPEEAEVTRIADNNIKVSGDTAEKLLKLIGALEENDDVQNVYAAFDIDEDELAKLDL
jgi:YebC/PmpR family DNA-binding regulatory protein